MSKSKQAAARNGAKPAAVADGAPAAAETVVDPALPAVAETVAEPAAAVVTVDGAEIEGEIGERDSDRDPVVVAVIVRTKGVPSRRRAGFGFTAEPTTIPADDLTHDQIEQLANDPCLDVLFECD